MQSAVFSNKTRYKTKKNDEKTLPGNAGKGFLRFLGVAPSGLRLRHERAARDEACFPVLRGDAEGESVAFAGEGDVEISFS